VVFIRRVDRFSDVRQSPATSARDAKATQVRRTGKLYSRERNRFVGYAHSIMRVFDSLRPVMAQEVGTPAC